MQHDTAQLNQTLATLHQSIQSHLDNARFEEAKSLIKQVLELVPNHPDALADLAHCERMLAQQNNEKTELAYTLVKQALYHAITRPTDKHSRRDLERTLHNYDVAVSICYGSNRFEEARWLGRQALMLRTSLAQQFGSPALPLEGITVPPLGNDPAENIISYSLFGSNPRYNETAVINAEQATRYYPAWTCRFYVDDSVPERTIARLRRHGAQIVDMSGDDIPGLFWRFLVAADAGVKRYIIRDADSLLSHKECAAVQQWLQSGRHFHVMRDIIGHTELILAGMWGGVGGVFTDMRRRIMGSLNEMKNDRTIDQQFLRYHIWNTVAQSVLIHDNNYPGPDSRPFPLDYRIGETECIPFFHIGMIDACRSTVFDIDDGHAQRVHWYLVDEHDQIICDYEADVDEHRQVKTALPQHYINRIEQGSWRILNRTIPPR